MVITRRLEVQMQDIQRALDLEANPDPKSKTTLPASLNRHASEDVVHSEGEKDRALARAALSVSELGALSLRVLSDSEFL